MRIIIADRLVMCILQTSGDEFNDFFEIFNLRFYNKRPLGWFDKKRYWFFIGVGKGQFYIERR